MNEMYIPLDGSRLQERKIGVFNIKETFVNKFNKLTVL